MNRSPNIFFLCILGAIAPLVLFGDLGITERAWVDFPPEPMSFHFGPGVQWSEEIDNINTEYNALTKTKRETLYKRISLLNDLVEKLGKAAEKINKPEELKRIIDLTKIAKKKLWYLRALEDMHKEDFKSIFQVIKHVLAQETNILHLVNNISFDTRLAMYWGLYWLEAIDPCHRLELTPYFMRWERSNKSTSFFLWLEGEHVPCSSQQVEVFSAGEVANCLIKRSAEGYLAYYKTGSIVSQESDAPPFLYVFTVDQELLVATGSKSIRHLSLTRGAPVLCSGEMKILKGEIVYVDSESGHYQPTISHLLMVIEHLKQAGIRLAIDMRVKYYSEGVAFEEPLKSLLKKIDQCGNLTESKRKQRLVSYFSLVS